MAKGCRFRPRLECLENRTLPSTIAWTNRGDATTDSDQFNAVFGSRAATARAVVDAALWAWQDIIQNFNFADGTNTLSLNIGMNPANRRNGAEAWSGLRTDGQGKPQAGRIAIDAGADGHGAGYFLDANPYNSSAFTGNLLNPYAREATSGGPAAHLGDLFTVVLHELTHVLGLNIDPNELFQRNHGRFLHNTGQADAVDQPGTLFTYISSGVQVLLTSDDGDNEDTGTAIHVARPGNSYTDPASHQTLTGTVDLMNPMYLFGRRVLVSQADAQILKDAYGYTMTTPPTFSSGGSSHPPAGGGGAGSGATAPILATAVNAGSGPRIQVYDAATGVQKFSFLAYDAGFTGGVRVAIGKVNGDGHPDIITAPGPGSLPVIRIFDGASGNMVREFYAYAGSFTGGVTVAVGDINGDGYPDIVTGTMSGNPHVKVFDGRAFATGTFNASNPDASLLTQFFPYALSFNVGANVAVGDVNGDGFADIVTGATAGNPHVKVFDGKAIAKGTFNRNNPDASLITQFFAYSMEFNVGANVAVGDVNGDGSADIITGATAGNPHVKVYDGKALSAAGKNPSNPDAALLAQFFAYGMQFNVGVNVAVGDVNGDGYADIITGASAGNPHVKVFNGKAIATRSFDRNQPDASLLMQFFASDPHQGGGVSVGAANARGP
jgi:hypothetical protein